MKLYKLLTAIILLSAQNIFAQMEPIITDRPDQTESPATVPVGYFQGEHGIQIDKSDYSTDFALPASLFRYGISENFELRLEIEPHIAQVFSNYQDGFMPLALGVKSRLVQNDFLELSLITHISFADLSSEDFKTLHNAITTRLTAAHDISEMWGIGCNFGVEWDGFDPAPYYVYTFTNGFSLGEKLGLFAEVFGEFSSAFDNHYADAGFTYLFSDNFQGDISGGFNFAGENYFGGVGLAYRFNTRSNKAE